MHSLGRENLVDWTLPHLSNEEIGKVLQLYPQNYTEIIRRNITFKTRMIEAIRYLYQEIFEPLKPHEKWTKDIIEKVIATKDLEIMEKLTEIMDGLYQKVIEKQMEAEEDDLDPKMVKEATLYHYFCLVPESTKEDFVFLQSFDETFDDPDCLEMDENGNNLVHILSQGGRIDLLKDLLKDQGDIMRYFSKNSE